MPRLFSLLNCFRPRHRTLLKIGVFAAVLLMARGVQAGPPPAPTKDPVMQGGDTDPIFHRHAFELQFMGGALFSLQKTDYLRPNIDYAPIIFRLGYMADTIYGRSFLRGNDEIMFEAMGAPIFTGPGNGLGGFSLIYRRNFLSAPGARVVPYLQGGGGGIYTDAYHERAQRALGAPFEFDLQAGTGVRFRLAPQWTLDAEFSFRHLSNASIASRNYGTNAIGGTVGVSYGF